jgi:hypothetical protein
MKKMKEFFTKNWAYTVIIALLTICVVFMSSIVKDRIESFENQNYSLDIYRDNIELMYEGARAELVENIDLTIRQVAPTTCMNGLAILRGCEKYGIDVFFVLAQGELESHFATAGMARKTNSAFNVYAFDGASFGQINKNGKYSHPDLSIEPYLKLLCEHYLVDGKTESDLMVNYINDNGMRYASSEGYESNLLHIYNKYMSNTTLQEAFKEYNKYKILSGR